MTRFRLFVPLAVLLACAPALVAAPAFAGNKDAVKQDNKLAPGYLQLPRMAVAVPIKGTDAARELEVELWVFVPDPLIMAKLTALRSVVADDIRDKLPKNDTDTYSSAEEGPTAIKEIAREVLEQRLGKDVQADVLIKKMLLR